MESVIKNHDMTPDPGSPNAVKLGCMCSIWDNANDGILARMWQRGRSFSVIDECPIHGNNTGFLSHLIFRNP